MFAEIRHHLCAASFYEQLHPIWNQPPQIRKHAQEHAEKMRVLAEVSRHRAHLLLPSHLVVRNALVAAASLLEARARRIEDSIHPF